MVCKLVNDDGYVKMNFNSLKASGFSHKAMFIIGRDGGKMQCLSEAL